MTERVVIDDKMICAVREAQERDAEDERRRHGHVNELGVGKRVNADHVDFP
jgi:hypothetical protein